MKNLYLFVFTICFAMTNLQAQNFTQAWKKLATGTDYWWFSGDNNTTSLAFNPVTNKLLVSKRAVGIYVVNPTTGAVEDSLKLQGIGTEGFRHNKIRVASDGAIYGISLATVAGPAKIYRWASQADTPVVCANFTVTERCGDAFGLSGSGNNTVLYASGAGVTPTTNAYNIYILNTTNGKDFTQESKVILNSTPAGLAWANRVVEPDGTGVNAPLWINGGGFNARKLTLSAKDGSGNRTGTVVTTIEDGVGSGQASLGYGGTRLFTNAANKKFLVLAGGNNAYAATKMTAINVTEESAPITFGIDSFNTQASYVTNGNGTGDVSFKDNGNNSFTAFVLSTNNGIAAYTSRIITGVKDVNSSNGFSVQTLNNPFNNELNIRINAATERKVTVNIVNIIGRVLITKQLTVAAVSNTIGFSTEHLPVGLYLVNINDGQSQKTVKIVKQ
jgi:Secretion system C-terminal sorting domain